MGQAVKQRTVWISEVGWFFVVSGAVQILASGLLLLTAYGLDAPSFFTDYPSLAHLAWFPLAYAGFVLFAAVRFLDHRTVSRGHLEAVCWIAIISGAITGIMKWVPWPQFSLGDALAGVISFLWLTMSPGVYLALMIIGIFIPPGKLSSSANVVCIVAAITYLSFLLVVIGYLRSPVVRSAMSKR
jgi:hypothetical protein